MAKKTNGREKLLEAWTPPQEAGAPIGCVATSYTFSTELFEEDCLSRFLRIESDSFEDDIIYVIEREEKLAQIKCAAALIDQHHCRGARSPRWDLIPVRVKNGVMHAKVSLLYWQGWIRVVIASANLSTDGYRTNQEVFGVLDFHEKTLQPRKLLEQTIEFLESILQTGSSTSKANPGAHQRVDQFLKRVKVDSKNFGTLDGSIDERDSRIYTAFLTPDSRRDILDQLQETWPLSTPPHDAFVLSPFYDKAEKENIPALKIWKLLRQRGEAYAEFTVRGHKEEDGSRYVLNGPKSLIDSEPRNREQVRTMILMYKDIQDKDLRPLHAKSIWLQDEKWISYLIGSSNFTTPGLGIKSPHSRRNFEANFIIQANIDRNPESRKYLSSMAELIESEEIDLETAKISWEPETDSSESDETPGLPEFFSIATYKVTDKKQQTIELEFNGTFSDSWRITKSETESADCLYDSEAWIQNNKPLKVSLPWPEKAPPVGLYVAWNEYLSYWPVNISSQDALVPPDVLRDLPLEVLIQILVSAKPMHEVIRKALKLKGDGTQGFVVDNDPHKRVDTSTFLLQRTRRISWALNALRTRLERPVATLESLKWRIWGPVGIRAIKEAILREAHSEAEKCFLMTELLGELSRVKPTTAIGCLDVETIRSELSLMNRELHTEIAELKSSQTNQLQKYIEIVLKGASL